LIKAPKMRAEPSETDLHLVRNRDGSCSANVPIDFSQKNRREDDLAADTRKCFGDEGGEITAALFYLLNDLGDVLRIFAPGLGIVAFVGATIIVCDGRNPNPAFSPSAPRAVEFVRTQINERRCVSMIG